MYHIMSKNVLEKLYEKDDFMHSKGSTLNIFTDNYQVTYASILIDIFLF